MALAYLIKERFICDYPSWNSGWQIMQYEKSV